MVNELKGSEEKIEYLDKQLAEIKVELDEKRIEAQKRQLTHEDQEKEAAAFRREIDMKDIEIKLHD